MILLIIADILLAISFVISKLYQTHEGVSFKKGLKFNILSALFTGVIFAVMGYFKNGHLLEYTNFSLLMALGMTLFGTAYSVISFKILEMGKMAYYTLFLMTGGMTVPYIWGLLFLNESFSLLRTFGLIIIIIAVIITNFEKEKPNLKLILLCSSVFLLNGFVSVTSKVHQINPVAVDTESFVLLTCIVKLVICTPVYFMIKEENPETEKKNGDFWYIILLLFLSSLVGGISSLCQLNGAIHLPATVVYPVITGGSIILTAIAGRICFKEKLSKQMIIGIILCFIGTCTFL